MSLAVTQAVAPPQITTKGFLVLRVGLGLFLLIAAGLKLDGLALDPLSRDSLLSSPRLQIATIEMEVLLGLWLLSGRQQRGARLVTLAFFGILAAASLYQGVEGQASCGCFGRVEVSPWWTFALDLGIVLVLAFSRPATAAVGLSPALAGLFKTAAGAIVVLAVIAGGFFLTADNPVAALAQLRGDAIVVEPAVSDVGENRAGEVRDFLVQLTNHKDHEVRIVGGTTTCACMATEDLPLTLPPHESRSISVRMKFSGSPGRFLHGFILYYTEDNKTQRVVVARFAGRVTAPASP